MRLNFRGGWGCEVEKLRRVAPEPPWAYNALHAETWRKPVTADNPNGNTNQFWKARSRHGRFPKFPEGDEGARMLLEACEDYFKWCEEHPLKEDKVFAYEGATYHDSQDKLRAFTLNGLTLFIDVTDQTWRDWRANRQDLLGVISWAEKTIRDQKFVAAAAGLLNANIISRDLGLADKTEISGPGGGPVQSITKEMTAEEAADLYAQTREAR